MLARMEPNRESDREQILAEISARMDANTKEINARMDTNQARRPNKRKQAKHSDSLNKSSLESTTQDDDFRQVKKRKMHNSDDTSQSAKNSTKTVFSAYLSRCIWSK
jgi:hypothetical protein